MRIIDSHVHLYDEPGYLGKLLAAMDALGVEKCCLSGLGELFGFGTNGDVGEAVRAHPDRIIGAYFVRPGVAGPEDIDRAYENGFRMLKVTLPLSGYESPEYFPLWERAAGYGMPVLFHTGIVTCKDAPGERISSWNMHPIRIEPITREFPHVNVIIAHLGVHWNNDAADLARMRPNVYVDLTGAPTGWRKRLDREGVETYLWWPGAFEKVVFGTDVSYRDMETILKEDLDRFDRLGVDLKTKERIFSGNILRLLPGDHER